MSNRIYVGNINYKATEEDLRELFSVVGSVGNASLVIDRKTGKLRGFGFVEMSTPDEAKNAIEKFHESEFMGRKIVVNEARPRQQQKQY